MSIKFTKVNIMDEKTHAKAYKQGVRAFVDLILNGARICGFRVMDHGKGLWVSPPTTKSEYKGKTYYHPVWSFVDDEHNEILHDDIRAKYKEVKAGNPIIEKKDLTEAEKPY